MSERVRAKKSLGQNFLIDQNIQKKIVAALELQPHDTVVEIGPGQGALTRHIAPLAGRLVLVELDDQLAATLKSEFAGEPHVEVVHANALDFDPVAYGLDPRTLKVVGNIPYNITTPLLFRLLQRERRPGLLVVMVQKEVAQRMVAPPGSGDFGALSVGIQTAGTAERLFTVSRGAFRPSPRVDSAVVRIRPQVPPLLSEAEEIDVRTLTRVAFAWRRKQLQRILRVAPLYALSAGQLQELLAQLEIDPDARPETLAADRFVQLARELRRRGLPHGEEQA